VDTSQLRQDNKARLTNALRPFLESSQSDEMHFKAVTADTVLPRTEAMALRGDRDGSRRRPARPETVIGRTPDPVGAPPVPMTTQVPKHGLAPRVLTDGGAIDDLALLAQDPMPLVAGYVNRFNPDRHVLPVRIDCTSRDYRPVSTWLDELGDKTELVVRFESHLDGTRDVRLVIYARGVRWDNIRFEGALRPEALKPAPLLLREADKCDFDQPEGAASGAA
jgi:hypothetical protein